MDNSILISSRNCATVVFLSPFGIYVLLSVANHHNSLGLGSYHLFWGLVYYLEGFLLTLWIPSQRVLATDGRSLQGLPSFDKHTLNNPARCYRLEA